MKSFARTTKTQENNSYYAGKPYAEFPVGVRGAGPKSADHRRRNPGLMNLNRTINHNKYEENRPLSQA